jgi:hypothetical protein
MVGRNAFFQGDIAEHPGLQLGIVTAGSGLYPVSRCARSDKLVSKWNELVRKQPIVRTWRRLCSPCAVRWPRPSPIRCSAIAVDRSALGDRPLPRLENLTCADSLRGPFTEFQQEHPAIGIIRAASGALPLKHRIQHCLPQSPAAGFPDPECIIRMDSKGRSGAIAETGASELSRTLAVPARGNPSRLRRFASLAH